MSTLVSNLPSALVRSYEYLLALSQLRYCNPTVLLMRIQRYLANRIQVFLQSDIMALFSSNQCPLIANNIALEGE